MPAQRCTVALLLTLAGFAACFDDDAPEPVGIMWGSLASGAFLGDTISLVAYYFDAAGAPMPFPRVRVSWASSRPDIVALVSESLGVALDTGRVTLTATTTDGRYTVGAPFTVIPALQGRLVWVRQAHPSVQSTLAMRQLPNQEVEWVPAFGYPGNAHGPPSLNHDGSKVAASATRPIAPGAAHTVFVVDLLTGQVDAPFEHLPGMQFAPVWLPGDTLLAFLAAGGAGWEIFTGRLDGTGVQQRTSEGQRYAPLFDVTPENHWILPMRPSYGGNADLWELTFSGDTVRQLTVTPNLEEYAPAVSPDGNQVAYQAGGHVWVMYRDGSNPSRLLPDRMTVAGTHAVAGGSGYPSWTTDARFILMHTGSDATFRPDGLGYENLSEIYAVRLSDRLALRLTRYILVDGQPVFR